MTSTGKRFKSRQKVKEKQFALTKPKVTNTPVMVGTGKNCEVISPSTPLPQEVSVTFLASTPKPGQPQLSRRRPFSTLQEEECHDTSVKSHKPLTTPVKRKPPYHQGSNTSSPSPRKLSRLSPGSSLENKIAAVNKQRVDKMRSRPLNLKLSSPRKSIVGKTSMLDSKKSNPRIQPSVQSKSSVYEYNKDTSSAESDSCFSDGLVAGSNIEEKLDGTFQSPSRLNSELNNRHMQTGLKSAHAKKTMLKEKGSKESKAVARKSGKKSILDDHEANTDSLSVTVWRPDSCARSKADVIDLDVIHTMLSKTLHTAISTCESVDVRVAMKTLNKYLSDDITKLISKAQNTIGLQRDVKRSEQHIKQLQKKLLHLQNERMELEEASAPQQKIVERNQHIREINGFLEGLQSAVREAGDSKQTLDLTKHSEN